jgi:hypothetical protein
MTRSDWSFLAKACGVILAIDVCVYLACTLGMTWAIQL